MGKPVKKPTGDMALENRLRYVRISPKISGF
jgi:hypothetical protein